MKLGTYQRNSLHSKRKRNLKPYQASPPTWQSLSLLCECLNYHGGMSKTFTTRTYNAWSSHKRRAVEAKKCIDYTVADLRKMIKEVIGYPCKYCGSRITEENFNCDHKEATSRGGSFSLDNVEIVCKRCNVIKGCMSSDEFSQLVALLSVWDIKAKCDVLRRLYAGGRLR